MIALLIGQMIASAFTRTVISRRAATERKRTRDTVTRPRKSLWAMTRHNSVSPRQSTQRPAAERARLFMEREASYQALIANGSIRPVPSAKWLSDQPVVCANGHRSQFGLFATLPGYGTLACLPDLDRTGRCWQRRVETLASVLLKRRCSARHHINDRDPALDGHWCLACPACGTDSYTFESPSVREYKMYTASADLFWVLCHLYHRQFPRCGACEVRRSYWDALGSLE
jgi:hypothetical protein